MPKDEFKKEKTNDQVKKAKRTPAELKQFEPLSKEEVAAAYLVRRMNMEFTDYEKHREQEPLLPTEFFNKVFIGLKNEQRSNARDDFNQIENAAKMLGFTTPVKLEEYDTPPLQRTGCVKFALIDPKEFQEKAVPVIEKLKTRIDKALSQARSKNPAASVLSFSVSNLNSTDVGEMGKVITTVKSMLNRIPQKPGERRGDIPGEKGLGG